MQKSKFHNIVSALTLVVGTVCLTTALSFLVNIIFSGKTSISYLMSFYGSFNNNTVSFFTALFMALYAFVFFWLLNKAKPITLFDKNRNICQRLTSSVLVSECFAILSIFTNIIVYGITYKSSSSIMLAIASLVGLIINIIALLITSKSQHIFSDSKPLSTNIFNFVAIVVYVQAVIILILTLFSTPSIKQILREIITIITFAAVQFFANRQPLESGIISATIEPEDTADIKETIKEKAEKEDTKIYPDIPESAQKKQKEETPMPFEQYSKNDENEEENREITPGPSPID